jgi:hypothetical protein
MQNLVLIAIAVVIVVVVMNGKGKKSFLKSVSKYLSGTNGFILLVAVILFMYISNRVEGLCEDNPAKKKEVCVYVNKDDKEDCSKTGDSDDPTSYSSMNDLGAICKKSCNTKFPGLNLCPKPVPPCQIKDDGSHHDDDLKCMKARDKYCADQQAGHCPIGPRELCTSPTNTPGDCRARGYSNWKLQDPHQG